MIRLKSIHPAFLIIGVILTAISLGCAPSDGPDNPGADMPDPNPFTFDDPREAFDYMEERLINVDSFYTGVIIDADSLFPVQLVAEVWGGPNNLLNIKADGNMAEFLAPATLRLVSDGERMVGGRSEEIGFDTTTARDLREAVAVGITRMGILHNLTRLYTGNAPDHSDGGVQDWVQVHSFEWMEPEVVARKLTRPMHFTISVDGEDTAEATLYIRRETGLPMRRVQTVQLADGGAISIDERYTGWAELSAPEGTFDIDAISFN